VPSDWRPVDPRYDSATTGPDRNETTLFENSRRLADHGSTDVEFARELNLGWQLMPGDEISSDDAFLNSISDDVGQSRWARLI
jgi:hypothetical protein